MRSFLCFSIACLLFIYTTVIARAQPAPLAVDASAQGRTLTIVVVADRPATLRITLPEGWTGAPYEQVVNAGVHVLSYALEPGQAVGQGEIVVQAWSGSAYASDRAWVWGRVAEAARAQRPGVRARLAVVRR
jgi:hypothetical protein